MAKQVPNSDAWVYNRHDRRRGTEPPSFICRNRDCGANLHEVGIVIFEGTSRYLAGRYQPGESEGSVIIEVTRYVDYGVEIQCGECVCGQPHLHLEDVEFDSEALTLVEAEALDG